MEGWTNLYDAGVFKLVLTKQPLLRGQDSLGISSGVGILPGGDDPSSQTLQPLSHQYKKPTVFGFPGGTGCRSRCIPQKMLYFGRNCRFAESRIIDGSYGFFWLTPWGSCTHTHTIHDGLFTYIWLIFMVNVVEYTSPMDPIWDTSFSLDWGQGRVFAWIPRWFESFNLISRTIGSFTPTKGWEDLYECLFCVGRGWSFLEDLFLHFLEI